MNTNQAPPANSIVSRTTDHMPTPVTTDMYDDRKRQRFTRRRFLKRCAAVLGAVGTADIAQETLHIEVTSHNLALPGLSQPCRLIQLSDLHRSWCVSEAYISRIIDKTNLLQPDVVLLTGDFVTHSSSYIQSCTRHIRRLKSPLGLYGVLGNHDYQCDNHHGARLVEAGLNEVNVDVLTNRHAVLSNGLQIVGVDDFRYGQPDPRAAFRSIKLSEPTIAMTHNPFEFGRMCAYDCVTLAGHTHGGQVNLPGITGFMLGGRMRYLKGWFKEPSGPGRMYVTRGLGVIGVPFRFHAAPEISVFNLHPVA